MRSSAASSHTKGPAVALLAKILAAGWYDTQRIASELVTDEQTLEVYLAGTAPMPLERQLCLARFLIETVPALSRQGHNLLGRVKAEIAYANNDVVKHQAAPAPNSRWY